MTSPNSNDDATSSKYNVWIGEGKGIVIGDNPQIVQQFYGPPAEPQVDLSAAEATYRQQVVDEYKWLDFSGFARPDLSLANVPLEEVFVRLSLIVEKVIREPVLSEDSSQAGRRQGRSQEPKTVREPIELGQALGNHLLIVGEPGAGKSTLLRWLAVTFAQGCQREPNRLASSADADRLPVLVELGRLPDRYVKPEGGETPNWIQLLPEYLSTQLAFTNTPPQLLARALADGRCLLLFDGLDEVADRQARTRLARSLAQLARRFPGNRVIIGSRPAGISESEGALRAQFQRCQIERFTPEDVQRFFRFWYALDNDLTPKQQHDEADALYARVQATPAILQLATTPLLSTILVLIWRNEGDLPQRRVDLYERCCQVLIERWEASHDVAYQGVLAGKDWEDHLHLLAPLAYFIHNEEQRTSATREELVRQLAEALQAEGRYNERDAAIRAAKQFLDTLGLRSGLLQYIGDDRYGFPHLTIQEYLAARYIAAQADLDYIDLVMAHLHEAWWQEVHLLTITHLGSGNVGASKASTLILTILHMYASPSWILRSSRNRWLRLIGPGKLLPQVQLARRIAWMQAREFELAAKGYAECPTNGTTAKVGTELSAQAASIVRYFLYDQDRFNEQKALLTVAYQLLQRQGNEDVVKALLAALHDADYSVQWQAAEILGQVGVGNEAVVSALLEALHDADYSVRRHAAKILGQVGVGNEAVVSALLEALHDAHGNVQASAAVSLGQVGVGNEAVVSALLEALHDAHWSVQERAAVSLGQVGVGNEAVVSALLEALHDAHWSVRERAAVSLGQMGIGNEAAVSDFLEALHDADWSTRWQAVVSLGQVGVGNEAVVSALLEALHDAHGSVQTSAAGLLDRMGVGNEAVVSALLEAALHDADGSTRWQAAGILGRMGVGNEAVVSALLEALHDADWNVRRRAAVSLGQGGVGNEAVVSALLEALHDADGSTRWQAVASLGQVGVGNEAVVSALLEALHDADSVVRRRAAVSLGQVEIKDPIRLRQVLVALNRCLSGWDRAVRQFALVSIRQLLDGRSIPGYQWVPLRKRRMRRLRLKSVAFWLGVTALMVLIGLAATWLLGALNSNGFPVRFLAVLAGIIAFVATVVQVLGLTLRDPWDHS